MRNCSSGLWNQFITTSGIYLTAVTVTYMHAFTSDDMESHSSHSLLHRTADVRITSVLKPSPALMVLVAILAQQAHKSRFNEQVQMTNARGTDHTMKWSPDMHIRLLALMIYEGIYEGSVHWWCEETGQESKKSDYVSA